MFENANFLCEIGTEEIPAGYIPPAIENAHRLLENELSEQRIDFDAIKIYATPRRFSILISGLSEEQRQETVELKGPSVKAAYDKEGNPSRALEGFMKGNNVSLSDIITRETDKGEYIFATKTLDSNKTTAIIPEILTKIISVLPFPKRMRWSNKELSFPRPITYFLLLFNNEVIPFEIEGISSSNKTRGHYVQSNEMVEISNISDYERILKKHNVILDQAKRKDIIRKALHEQAAIVKGKVIEDEDLLDIVTYLVEDPHVIVCSFDPDFLRIPEICLIAEMKEHQKYFGIEDSSGKLTNHFLVTSNNPKTDQIVAGNIRVLSARFSDADFFYAEDRKKKLADLVDSLKNVLFHRDLGSIFEKVERLMKAGGVIAQELSLDKDKTDKILRALYLSKADLNTAMVYEFASLQGKIGAIYALEDGEDSAVAAAIEYQYKPGFHGDELPKEIISVVASLSEKFDNIFGSFSVGNIPKGSADPYALRRQANAILEIIIQNNLNCDLRKILNGMASSYKDGTNLVENILEFISARAKTIFMDKDLSHDEIDACLSTGQTDYLELLRRAKSVNEFRKNDRFSEMLLSFKRMNNIASAFRKGNSDHSFKLTESKLSLKEEKELKDFFDSKKGSIQGYIAQSEYIKLFELLIEGKDIIDAFFDNVLVMDEDLECRDNRLFIIEGILANFQTLMDFSKITDKQ